MGLGNAIEEVALRQDETIPEEGEKKKKKKSKCKRSYLDSEGFDFKMSTGWCYGPNKENKQLMIRDVFQVEGKFKSSEDCAAAVRRDAPGAMGGVLNKRNKNCYGMEKPITMGNGCNELYVCFKFKN